MLKAIVFSICMYLSRHLEEQPKQKWRKAQMKEWLDSKGTILYSLWMMYLILILIVFDTDKIAEEKGGF